MTTSNDDTTSTSISWVKHELENLMGVIGEEVALMQKAEREEVDRQFRLFQKALELQALRLAELEALISTPKRSRVAPAEKPTASLVQGRAS